MFATSVLSWFTPGTVLAIAGSLVVIAILLSGKVKQQQKKVAINFDDATAKAPFPACTLAPAEKQIGCRTLGTHDLSTEDIVFFRFPEQERGESISIKEASQRLGEQAGTPGGLRPLPDQYNLAVIKGDLPYPRSFKRSEIITLGRVWHTRFSDIVTGVCWDERHEEPQLFHLRPEQDSLKPNTYIACLRDPAQPQAPQRAKAALAA